MHVDLFAPVSDVGLEKFLAFLVLAASIVTAVVELLKLLCCRVAIGHTVLALAIVVVLFYLVRFAGRLLLMSRNKFIVRPRIVGAVQRTNIVLGLTLLNLPCRFFVFVILKNCMKRKLGLFTFLRRNIDRLVVVIQ